MNSQFPPALLWLPQTTVTALLTCYDYPHPDRPGHLIEGYDKAHALRTAKMCAAVAQSLAHAPERIKQYQATCLLHDLGRAGLDPALFGTIWRWAREQNIPTRPAEWRAAHPETSYGQETEAFIATYHAQLQALGIPINAWTTEQIEMRLGYARRLRRIVGQLQPALAGQGVGWCEWMEQVVCYYYYPEQLDRAAAWVRELGEILVACEQLEAYSNRDRGSVYYNRTDESFADAFNYLSSLKARGQLGEKVLHAVQHLAAAGVFDEVLADARSRPLTDADRDYLRSLNPH